VGAVVESRLSLTTLLNPSLRSGVLKHERKALLPQDVCCVLAWEKGCLLLLCTGFLSFANDVTSTLFIWHKVRTLEDKTSLAKKGFIPRV